MNEMTWQLGTGKKVTSEDAKVKTGDPGVPQSLSLAVSRMLFLLTHPLVTLQEQKVAPISNTAL